MLHRLYGLLLQEEVYFLMLPNDELDNFKITVILAVVGQAVGMTWTLWRQVRKGGRGGGWGGVGDLGGREGGCAAGRPKASRPRNGCKLCVSANYYVEVADGRPVSLSLFLRMGGLG